MEYWFRKVPNRNGSERYAATSWKGYAVVIAAVAACQVPIVVPGIPDALRIVAFVPWLLVVLVVLFVIVRKRAAPPDNSDQP